MRINLKQFKKIKEDNATATLKNERGHEITLAKKSLRPHLLKTLTLLPLHLKEGTPEGVEDPKDEPSPGAPDPTPSPAPPILSMQEQLDAINSAASQYIQPQFMNDPSMQSGMPPTMGQIAQDVGNTLMAPAGAPPQPTPWSPEGQAQAQMAAPDQMPHGAPAPAQGLLPNASAAPAPQPGSQLPDAYDQYQKGISKQMSGIQEEANAAGALGKRQAAIYAERAEAAKQVQMNYQQQLGDLNTERENVMEDIRNSKINPNQYVENMGSRQKSYTMIGLLLSGAGAGLSHQNNLAADFLQKQIDRDINAQVANLNQKNNLLHANMQQFQNLHQATEMTRINLQDIMASQIAEEASKSAYPMAQAKAHQAIGMLMSNSAERAHALAVQKMMWGNFQQQQRSGQAQDPASKIRMMSMAGMMPADDKKTADKELGSAQRIEKLRGDVEEQAQHLQSKVGNGILTPGDRSSALNSFAGILAKEAEGRFNLEESKNQMDALMPSPGDLASTLKNKAMRRKQFFDSFASHPVLDQYGIQVQPVGRYGAGGGKRFDEQKAVKPK